MKSKEVVGTGEGADMTEETLEAFLLAEIVEESHVRAGKETKKRKTKEFVCVYCEAKFNTGQALGGHMNGHKKVREEVKIVHSMEFLQRMGCSGPFNTVNARNPQLMQPMHPGLLMEPELPMSSTSFFQNSLHQMTPSQVLPVDPQLRNWPQAATNDMNLRGPTDDFTSMPRLRTACATSDASVTGNYGPQSVELSMAALPSSYSVLAPNVMYSPIQCGNPVPSPFCVASSSGSYQDPQMNMHTQQSMPHSSVIISQQRVLLASNVQQTDSTVAQYAQALVPSFPDSGSQELAVPQDTIIRPDPSEAVSDDAASTIFAEWTSNPVSDLVFPENEILEDRVDATGRSLQSEAFRHPSPPSKNT